MPTLAATKRLVNSLESSSMEMFGLNMALMKERFKRIPCAPELGQQAAGTGRIGQRHFFLSGERMIDGRNYDQFIAVDRHYGVALVFDWHRDHAEVAGVLDDGLKNLLVLRTFHADSNVRILAS